MKNKSKKISDDLLPIVRCALDDGIDAAIKNAAPMSSQEKALRLLKRDYTRKLLTKDKADDRSDKAFLKWLDVERHCFSVNRRLEQVMPASSLGFFFESVRNKIRNVIGERAPKNLFRNCHLTSGASYGTKRGMHISRKLERITLVRGSALLWPALLGLFDDIELVEGNKMHMVPKTTDIDRVISIEPSGNVFLQSAVGSFLRERLKRVGIDLNNQEHNQNAAFHAAADGLATIDLESASDTLCTELVRLVLPDEWFSLLDTLRSPKTRLPDGSFRVLEKFASMGNGFTFELETLIFWALSSSVDPHFSVLAYGDDIICSQKSAPDVMACLGYCGFIINQEKSFITGSYFESCGKHYFDLDEVTPVFQKEPIDNVHAAMRAHNRLVRWALRTKCVNAWPVIRRCLRIIRNAYPRFDHCEVPFGAQRDDGWLVDPRILPVNPNGYFICNTVVIKTIHDDDLNERLTLAYKLYRASYSNEDPKGYPKRTARTLPTELVRTRTVVWVSSLIN